ncbi:MAG: hypothetical protein KFW09_01670 [Oscillospiraceae bacterium]|nr:hypothetical protein [Oscillospiraceae bacterium]
MKKNKKWEWSESSSTPANPYASHQPQPANPYASHQPQPANPYASHQPQPTNPYASHQPQPANPYASHQPQPANPYASHQPQPANPYASHQPQPLPEPISSSCDTDTTSLFDTLVFDTHSANDSSSNLSPDSPNSPSIKDKSPSSTISKLFSSVFLPSNYHISHPGSVGVWNPGEDFDREQKEKEEQKQRHLEQERIKPEILKMFQNELYVKQQAGLPITSLSVEEDRCMSTESTTDYENYSDWIEKSTKF